MEQISKSYLYRLCQQQLSQESNHNDQYALQIMNTLGGINYILEEMLSDKNNIEISQNKLSKLYQLLITPQNYTQQQTRTSTSSPITLNSQHNDTKEIYSKHDKMSYKFEIKNTFLHKLQDDKCATLLIKQFHTKTAHLLHVISIICYFILRFGFQDTLLFPIYTLIVAGIGWQCYFVGWILSANVYALRLVSKSFEFWFKVGNTLIGCTAFLMERYVLLPTFDDHNTLRIISEIIFCSNCILAICIVSAFDALYLYRLYKVCFSLSAALSLTFVMLFIMYDTYFNDIDDVIIEIYADQTLSLRGIEIGALQVLTIFSWKQTYKTIRKKDRCVLIKYSPYIQWIDNDNEENTNNTINDMDRNGNVDRNDKNDEHKETALETANSQNLEQQTLELQLSVLNTGTREDSNTISSTLSHHL